MGSTKYMQGKGWEWRLRYKVGRGRNGGGALGREGRILSQPHTTTRGIVGRINAHDRKCVYVGGVGGGGGRGRGRRKGGGGNWVDGNSNSLRNPRSTIGIGKS